MKHHLHAALSDLKLTDHERVVAGLADHWALVKSWNARSNLTAITNDEEAAWSHYRDSLEALRAIPAGDLADLGTGGGFPGVPLAIADPSRLVTLVESRAKKCSFLTTAVARLGLKNVRILNVRAEAEPERQYAVVVTRATFSQEADLRACLAWLSPGGLFVAFRSGQDPLASCEREHRYVIRGAPRTLCLFSA